MKIEMAGARRAWGAGAAVGVAIAVSVGWSLWPPPMEAGAGAVVTVGAIKADRDGQRIRPITVVGEDEALRRRAGDLVEVGYEEGWRPSAWLLRSAKGRLHQAQVWSSTEEAQAALQSTLDAEGLLRLPIMIERSGSMMVAIGGGGAAGVCGGLLAISLCWRLGRSGGAPSRETA